ncbi:MAG TPA: LacI family DNA-binding transcriptional regulator [Chthoniobacterales bacterium]|nr:LacI family DNA-binding transcriptional regulator [Chthoniobacterales bacterium]
MNVQRRVSIGEIVAATGLSRATVDRVLNKRSGVHPRTHAHVLRVLARLESDGQERLEEAFALERRKAYRFGIVIQAGETFTRSVLNTVQRLKDAESSTANLQGAASSSDEETIELIQTLGRDVDGLALVSKNIEPVKSALKELRGTGKNVVALVSDLDATVRNAYVGIDNRAAGQLAAFMLGRCLERAGEAKVAVVVGYFSYLCQEDREIGFRSLLRQRFPQIEIVEVIKGDDSREATYEAALRLLKNRRDIAGIYNVAGGNFGLAKAIEEAALHWRPLYITHEVNEVTEPLLRKGVIDFLISQNIDSLVRTSRQVLIDLRLNTGSVRELNYLPVQVVSEFTLVPSAAA